MPILATMNALATQTWRRPGLTSPITGIWTQRTTPAGVGLLAGGVNNLLNGFIGKIIQSLDNGVNWTASATIFYTATGIPLTAAQVAALSLYDMAYNGTNYFLASSYGLFTSSNGTTWQIANFVTPTLNGVITRGTNWLAVGNYGSGFTSGVIFYNSVLQSNPLGLTNLQSVTDSGTRFVAVSYGGGIIYSNNGSTWTIATSGTTNNLQGVTYANGLFVAVGDNGTILTSPDGITWTIRTSGVTTNSLQDVAYGGTGAQARFVIVGSSGLILSSTNGVTWTRETVPTNVATASFITVSFNGTYFIIGGADSLGQTGVIVTGT